MLLPTQSASGVELLLVTVERLLCLPHGTEGWASENWPATGVFPFNDQTLVQVPVLHDSGRYMAIRVTLAASIVTLFLG